MHFSKIIRYLPKNSKGGKLEYGFASANVFQGPSMLYTQVEINGGDLERSSLEVVNILLEW